MANVPTSETTMAMVGMSVERMSCKKTYTTRTTSKIASMSVHNTFSIEA